MIRYFVHDLETDKLRVYTGGKTAWLALADADRTTVKANCLWSKARECWVSKARAGSAHLLRQLLARLGFEDRGTVGERLTFAEQIAAKQERAELRAERMEDRAEAAQDEATSRFGASRAILDVIPMGQPILVGHHSEKRHRRDLERADNHMRAGVEALDKAEHYQRRAEAARPTADGARLSDPAFLGRRISEAEAEERQLLHRLEGKFYAHSDPQPISEEYRASLARQLEEVRDRLGFYRHCLETCGRKVWDRESLKGMRQALVRHEWQQIVKLNPKTVSVQSAYVPWPLKYPYTEVKDAR